MPELYFEALHSEFGARVTGLSLTDKFSQESVSEIQNAIDQYSLLCFPNQNMTDEAQLAFTHSLGEPEEEHVTLGKTGKVVYFGTVGNVLEAGSKREWDRPNHPISAGKRTLAF